MSYSDSVVGEARARRLMLSLAGYRLRLM